MMRLFKACWKAIYFVAYVIFACACWPLVAHQNPCPHERKANQND